MSTFFWFEYLSSLIRGALDLGFIPVDNDIR